MSVEEQLAAALRRISELESALERLLSENRILKERLAEAEKKSAVK